MAHYNNKDQRNLEELIEEGWFDRLKTRGAEALGSAKGLGQQVKGGFQQAAGSALTMAGKEKGKELSQQGRSNRSEGMISGHNSKVQYLQKNIDKRIQSFVDDIKNDIKKLGLDIGNIEIVSGINDALNLLKKSVSGDTTSPQQVDDNNGDDDFKYDVNFGDDDNGDFKYDANFGDDLDGVSTTPTKKSQKNSNYKGKGFDQQTDLPDPSNMTYKQGKVDYNDVADGYTAGKTQRSNSAKRGAETKKNNKFAPNSKKSKINKDPLARHLAPEQEEDLEKMFWDD